MKPLYPKIKVKLVGEDGNAFFILSRCYAAAKSVLTEEEWSAFETEAKSGDYKNLLRTCMKYFTCK